MPGSIIKNIKGAKCGWDGKPLDGHSHKNLMRCLYRSNVEVFRSIQVLEHKDVQIKKLQTELAKFVIEEEGKKADTGLMDVKSPIDLTDAIKDEKKLAKDMLEAESFIKTAKDVK